MRAMNPKARSRVDVEPAMNHDVVAGVYGHRRRESGVVVDLEHLAGRYLDLKSFVTARLDGVIQHRGIEGHLRAIGVADDVLVQCLVVRRIASSTGHGDHGDQKEEPEPLHVARACSTVMRPS